MREPMKPIRKGTLIRCASICNALIGIFSRDVDPAEPAMPDQIVFHDLGAADDGTGTNRAGLCSSCGARWLRAHDLVPPIEPPA